MFTFLLILDLSLQQDTAPTPKFSEVPFGRFSGFTKENLELPPLVSLSTGTYFDYSKVVRGKGIENPTKLPPNIHQYSPTDLDPVPGQKFYLSNFQRVPTPRVAKISVQCPIRRYGDCKKLSVIRKKYGTCPFVFWAYQTIFFVFCY